MRKTSAINNGSAPLGALKRARRAVEKILAAAPPADPVEAAKVAGLRYVSDRIAGIHRKRVGKGFVYVRPDGSVVRDPNERRRLGALAIPPAWTDVWICPTPNGHLQATGRDAKGRKQYRYHRRWREVRDETKYDRMMAFALLLPQIRRRVSEDLAQPGLPREKVLATVVRLLETTHIRVGNEEYARQNQSFGLTTMRNNHVDVSGAKVRFEFRGKSGVKHSIDVSDLYLAQIVKRLRDLPGQELFQYIDEDGEVRTVDSADVNEYLRLITGEDFTAKDFRTWAGTVLAACALGTIGTGESETQAKRNIAQAIDEVARQLGNTRAVCRKCYVHPAVIECYMEGALPPISDSDDEKQSSPPTVALRAAEAAVLRLLQKRLEKIA